MSYPKTLFGTEYTTAMGTSAIDQPRRTSFGSHTETGTATSIHSVNIKIFHKIVKDYNLYFMQKNRNYTKKVTHF